MKLDLHLFAWPSRHNIHVALPLMLALSFLLHVAGVAVFQIAYPRSQARPHRSAEVFFLRPGSPEASQLAPILAASDPALFSPGQIYDRNKWELPETAYVASFDSTSPALLPLPATTPEHAFPPVSPTGPITKNKPASHLPASRAPGVPTRVRLGGALAGREMTPPQDIHFSALPRQGLTPAEFLIAVSPDGLPLHLFPQSSSGNETLDRAALRYLAGSRFAPLPDASQPAWGTVTFLWGADVERVKAP